MAGTYYCCDKTLLNYGEMGNDIFFFPPLGTSTALNLHKLHSVTSGWHSVRNKETRTSDKIGATGLPFCSHVSNTRPHTYRYVYLQYKVP